MWDSYRRDLRRAVRTSPGREKGLLVANYEAEREIYGTTSLTPSTLREGVKDIGPPDEARQFHTHPGGSENGCRCTSRTSRRVTCDCVNALRFSKAPSLF